MTVPGFYLIWRKFMNDPSARVLIVEDETNIRAGLHEVLAIVGHQLAEAASGEEALEVLQGREMDVAVVDIRMPGMSGIDLLKEIRARWPFLGVILLTGHGTLDTAMQALKAGANDYLLKPAAPAEIRGTVDQVYQECLRRKSETRLIQNMRRGLRHLDNEMREPNPPADFKAAPPNKLRAGDLIINLAAHTVMRAGKEIDLTPTEFKLLVALARRAGEVLSYTALVEEGLGYQAEPWEARELVKRHVFSMRKKVEPDPSSPRHLLNVRGVGYRLDPR